MKIAIIAFVMAGSTLISRAQTNSPSLAETFDWMTNTLKPTEGNNRFTHHPTPRPYVRDWVDEEIDPYHTEEITGFTHDGCHIQFEVQTIDNDMGLLLGKYFRSRSVETFDLKDIDQNSVRIQNSCEPVQTSSGPVEPSNCQDTQGKIVLFQTVDAKPKIHEEVRASSRKSRHGVWGVVHRTEYNLDEMCKEANANGDSGNGAYCDQSETKETPKDLTSAMLGFSTPLYAKRFAKALGHAIQLCGGHTSAF